MLSMKFIRENSDAVRKAIQDKGEKADLDKILELDAKWLTMKGEDDGLKHEMKIASEQIGKLKKSGQDASEALAKTSELKEKIKNHHNALTEIENERDQLLYTVPNIPHKECPIGGEEANEILHEWGDKREFDFEPKPHWELGESLNMFDLPRGAKLSGTGFVLYKNNGARLVRALLNFMLDFHSQKHGYTEVWPPTLVNAQSMTGTGQLPKFEDDMYKVDNLYMIPTAEVPVTGIHSGEILEESDLPKYFCAYSQCFRREAGAYGKDTRGLIRLHQFDKIELVKLVTKENELDELHKLMADAEAVLMELNIPYRRKILATGDMTFASSRTYDLEIWCAGVGNYQEVSSCSCFGDFQARRLNCRYRPQEGGKPEFVRTMNGSGVALPRLLIAIIENNQQQDGSLVIPEKLRPYLGGQEVFSV